MPFTPALLLALVQSPAAAPSPDPDAALVDTAFAAIRAGKPQQAMEMLAPMLARFDAEAAGEKRQRYCAMGMTETLLYMTMAAKEKHDAVATSPQQCTGLFLKGFALVDLGRLAEAQAAYRQVLALAPMHSHFITEYGQTFRFAKNWPEMLATCRRASDAALIAPQEVRKAEQTAAWRCQGFALIEQRRWKEAKALYDQCLKLDPEDAKAKNELRYIAEQEGRNT